MSLISLIWKLGGNVLGHKIVVNIQLMNDGKVFLQPTKCHTNSSYYKVVYPSAQELQDSGYHHLTGETIKAQRKY